MAKVEMEEGARSDSDVAGMAMAKGRTVEKPLKYHLTVFWLI